MSDHSGECIICYTTFLDCHGVFTQDEVTGWGPFKTYNSAGDTHIDVENNVLTETRCCASKICIGCLYSINKTTKKCPLKCKINKFAPSFEVVFERRPREINTERHCSRCGSSNHQRSSETWCPLYTQFEPFRIPTFTSARTRASYQILFDHFIKVVKDRDMVQNRLNNRISEAETMAETEDDLRRYLRYARDAENKWSLKYMEERDRYLKVCDEVLEVRVELKQLKSQQEQGARRFFLTSDFFRDNVEVETENEKLKDEIERLREELETSTRGVWLGGDVDVTDVTDVTDVSEMS